ncbi:YSIRK-type signal peptide-containing protein [Lactobacillus paragasseri]|uniref:mucin-binding protein n=1 Tax=Lactobacillus paragasseri TaxID=2107999 RepID=UPI0029C16D5A|nr:YSIRK-type signal peptide-containing protein [Lactobacillus paragasseri]MDX5117344.1 YSIRK-type signal peptide-containing protein [Lactobacillus paragasseri]MDX5139658.1 YSIRK-type signal peptide-containing protein [Lactobacillus paragasseri]MDX5145144.1 YSIRK-type signal peptide-containing protein [Lactobacillus paragasseri]
MVSKNNYSEKMRKIRPQKPRFSIRKFTVGAASVLIGLTFMGVNGRTVKADTTVAQEESVNVTSNLADSLKENVENTVSTEEQSEALNAEQAKVASIETNNEVENTTIDNNLTAQNTNGGGTEATEHLSNSQSVELNLTPSYEQNNESKNDSIPSVEEGTTNVENLQTANEEYKAVSVETNNSSESTEIVATEEVPKTEITDKVAETAPVEAETKIENAVSPIEETVVEENNQTTGQTDVKEVQSKASVTIPATDTDKYPKEAGALIGNDKYIYQILNLNNTGTWNSSNKKLILSVNRNDLTDENLYAYVTDADYKNLIAEHIIKAGYFKKIEVSDRDFLIVNSGKSNITVGGSSMPVGNATTVVGSTKIVYGLGNITNLDASSVGEIIPVHTEESVIKYYYHNKDGNLVEIPGTDKYPNVSVSGWTGQEFVIDNVDQYKQLIDGFYLDGSNIPSGSFTGTISQFGDGSYYKKVYYSSGNRTEGTVNQLTVDFTVVYRQIDATGKMEVLMYDGSNMDRVIESHTVEAGKSVKFTHKNFTARNPFVTDSAHEVQFIYKDLGSIIPVDENGNQIGDAVKFNNNLTDPTEAGRTEAPIIAGYIADIEYVIPENPGEDIKVVYRLREDAKATITIIDMDNDRNSLAQLNATGKVYSQINFVDLNTTLASLIDGGYVVISNNYRPGTQFGVHDLNFEIQLKHVLEAVNESQTVQKDIHYVDTVGNELRPSTTQTATFTATGYRDKVTGNIVLVAGTQQVGNDLIATEITNKNASLKWTADKTTFESLKSPDIIGYTTNQKWSTADKVEQNEKLKIENIIYDKKAQVGTIVFWDETSQKQLGTTINIAGNYGEVINYQVIDNVLGSIKNYENNGYILVNNPLGYTTVFGDADYNPGCNDYVITLKHKIAENSQTKEVNRVITYVYADGPNKGQVAASSVTQKVSFIGKGQYDFVDKVWISDIVWTAEDGNANYTFAQVNSPKISGYGANRLQVESVLVSGNSDNITEEVLYYANQQTAQIQYIDDVTGKVIGSDTVNGKVDHIISWNLNPEATLKMFENNGYKLVSSDYEFGKDYYYSAEEAKNRFKVHLTRDLIIIDPKDPDSPVYGSEDYNKEVTQEIQYVYANGNAAAESNKQTVKFTAYGVVDKTTGKYVVLDENGKVILGDDGEPIEGKLVWNANVSDPKFTEVSSPTITGYTPDKANVAGTKVTHDMPSNVIVVTYTANDADAKVIFVDKTTGKELEAVMLNGKYGDIINYSTADKIKYYENLGYELVSDGYNGGEFGETTKTFYVTFKHGVVHVHPENPGKPGENINPGGDVKYPTDSGALNKDVTHTVHYVYADGTTANPSHTQTITFTGSGHINKVTGEYVEVDEDGNIKLDADGKPVPGKLNWVATLGNSFLAVTSPEITGHTPSHVQIDGVENVAHDSENYVHTVTYTANSAKAEIVYVDETTGKELEIATVDGKYNETINYSTADKIKYYESLGYELVKDGYTGGEYGETIKKFYVTFKHGTVVVNPENPGKPDEPINPDDPNGSKYPSDSANLNKDVTHTIHYVYADGTTAKPSHTQTLTFKGSGVIDKVTGQYVVLDENGNIKLDANGKPIPDKTVVNAVEGINQDSKNIETKVVYTANVAKAEIIYVDETTGKELEVDTVDGKYNETINYSTADKIKYYESLGYELVKDGYTGGEFGEATETFYVTFKHGTVVVNPDNPGKPDEPINPDNPDGPKYPTDSANLNKDVTHTIYYVYADGTVAKPSHTQTLTFTGSGVIDKVTGQYVEVDENGNVKLDENGKPIPGKLTWTAKDGTTFIEVISPTISGYTPDQPVVNAVEGINQDSKNIETKVVYTANAAKAEIIYVDETTGKALETATVDGKYNESINYSTADKIKYYESLGYELVKDGYTGGKFGETTKIFYVIFKHGTITVTPDDKFTEDDPINPDNPEGPKYPFDSIALDKTITRTIKYVYADGTKAKDDVVQTLRFRGTAVIDKVTGEIIILDENGRKVSDGIKWTALDGTTFVQVISPEIAGYTADKKEIGSVENVDSDTEDITETVVYSKNSEKPVEPGKPEEPEKPVEPGKPEEPEQPVEPGKPEEPEQPVEPGKPEEPVEPDKPEEPEAPVESEQPEVSEKQPTETTEPDKSDADTLPDNISIDNTAKNVSTVEHNEPGKVEAATTNEASLPQTGHKHANVGIIGLGLATIASILGLAGTRKRKKN